MRYYRNGTEYEIKKKDDGRFEITAYGRYIATENTLDDALTRIKNMQDLEQPMEKLF